MVNWIYPFPKGYLHPSPWNLRMCLIWLKRTLQKGRRILRRGGGVILDSGVTTWALNGIKHILKRGEGDGGRGWDEEATGSWKRQRIKLSQRLTGSTALPISHEAQRCLYYMKHSTAHMILAQGYWFWSFGLKTWTEYICVVVSHQVCGNWWQQPEETNAVI